MVWGWVLELLLFANVQTVVMNLKRSWEFHAEHRNVQNVALPFVVHEGNDLMTLICVPTKKDIGPYSEISMHFGKTSFFTFAQVEGSLVKKYKVEKFSGMHEDGSKAPAELISDLGVDIVICAHLGSKAISTLTQRGIIVFSGASGTVEDVLKEWRAGKLSSVNKISWA